MDKRKKTVFQLDSPFASSQWPKISVEDQNTILETLISLVATVGQWRSNNTIPSRGKRDKKRKRKAAKSSETQHEDTIAPLPEIASFIRVGLNSVSRALQCSAITSRPSTDKLFKPTSSEPLNDHQEKESHGTYLAAVFVARQSQSSAIDTHLPKFIAASAMAHPKLPAPRLVQLPSGSDARLCEALGVARVSIIGLLDGAPHSISLVELVRRCVPEVEIPWLQEARKADYLAVKINAIETSIGPAKEREKRKKVPEKKNGA